MSFFFFLWNPTLYIIHVYIEPIITNNRSSAKYENRLQLHVFVYTEAVDQLNLNYIIVSTKYRPKTI